MSNNADALLKEIESINSNIIKLNNKTAKDIGRKEEIQKQIGKSIQGYEEKYGVKLDIQDKDSIQAEYDAVRKAKELEVEKMKKAFDLLSQNKYTEVYGLLGVSNKEETGKSGLTPEKLKNLSSEFKLGAEGAATSMPVESISETVEDEVDTETEEEEENTALSNFSFAEEKIESKQEVLPKLPGMPSVPEGFSFDEPVSFGGTKSKEPAGLPEGTFKIPDFSSLVKGTQFEN